MRWIESTKCVFFTFGSSWSSEKIWKIREERRNKNAVDSTRFVLSHCLRRLGTVSRSNTITLFFVCIYFGLQHAAMDRHDLDSFVCLYFTYITTLMKWSNNTQSQRQSERGEEDDVKENEDEIH